MSAPWFMTTVVCDDVRKEEGNKLSYMGIYGTNIVVPNFPVTLPKLCFVMTLMASGTQPVPESLSFRVLRDDDVLAEITVPPASFVEATRAKAQADRDAKRLTFGTVVQMFPLQLDAPCVLKARAICDGEEIRGGSWPVQPAGQP